MVKRKVLLGRNPWSKAKLISKQFLEPEPRIQNEGGIGNESIAWKNQLVLRESGGQKITQINMENNFQKESSIDQTKQLVSKEPDIKKEALVTSKDNGEGALTTSKDPDDEVYDEFNIDSG